MRNPKSERQLQESHASRRRAVSFLSPLPSPLGKGHNKARLSKFRAALDLPTHWRRFPLSPRERAGMRGNGLLIGEQVQVLQLAPEMRNPRQMRSPKSECEVGAPTSSRLTAPLGLITPSRCNVGVPQWRLLAFSIVAFALCLGVQAQTFSIPWFTVDGGGGTSTGGVYAVSGTIGQPDAGRLSGGQFTLEGGFWGVVAAIQTEGAPLLAIELINASVKVSWPAPAAGWVLTETNRLTGPGGALWPTVSAAQYQTNEGRIFILTAPQPMENRFYRLRRP